MNTALLTKENISNLRKDLGMSQETMRKVLGVTKTTVGRYETGMAVPVGDSAQKLRILFVSMADKEQRRFILNILSSNGGFRVLAAVLGLCVAAFDASEFEYAMVTMTDCVAGPLGKSLLSVLGDFHKLET